MTYIIKLEIWLFRKLLRFYHWRIYSMSDKTHEKYTHKHGKLRSKIIELKNELLEFDIDYDLQQFQEKYGILINRLPGKDIELILQRQSRFNFEPDLTLVATLYQEAGLNHHLVWKFRDMKKLNRFEFLCEYIFPEYKEVYWQRDIFANQVVEKTLEYYDNNSK